MATKNIVSSACISYDDPKEHFGFTDGQQFLRARQDGKIIFFSIPRKILITKTRTACQQQEQQQKITLTDMPPEVLLLISSFCSPVDHICLALSVKHLASSMSLVYAGPAGALSMTVDWSVTTALFLRQALLKRIHSHHSSPTVRLCADCNKLCTTDIDFWWKEHQRVLASSRKMWVGGRKMMQVEELKLNFECNILAWQDQTPVVPGDPNVYCPGCAALRQHEWRRSMTGQDRVLLRTVGPKRPPSSLH